jgi:hypothetical protein
LTSFSEFPPAHNLRLPVAKETILDFLMLFLLGGAAALIAGYIHVCILLTNPAKQSADRKP